MDTKPALKIAEVDPANLGDPSDRARFAPAAIKAMIRIADVWKLNVGEACALLGGISERTWYRMKKGEAGEASGQDILTRISAIVGIYKGLRILFSEPLSNEWVFPAAKPRPDFRQSNAVSCDDRRRHPEDPADPRLHRFIARRSMIGALVSLQQANTVRLIPSARLKPPILAPLADTQDELDNLARLESATQGRLLAQESGWLRCIPRELVLRSAELHVHQCCVYIHPTRREPLQYGEARRLVLRV